MSATTTAELPTGTTKTTTATTTRPRLRLKPLPAGVMRLLREGIEAGLYLAFYASLLFSYVTFFPQNFSYEGYVEAFDAVRAAVAIPLVLGLVVVVQRAPSSTSLLLHMGLMLVVMPMIVLWVGAGKTTAYLATGVLSFLVIVGVVRVVRLRPLRLANVGSAWTLRWLIALVGGIILAMGALGGFRHFNLSLASVYEFRDEAADNLPGVFGYLIPAATKIFLPFGLIVALYRRSVLGVVAIAVGVVLMFGLSSHKAILVYPVLVVGLYVIAGSRWCVSLFVLGLTGLVNLASLLLTVTENPAAVFFSSMVVRRGIILPAELTSYYLNWFLEQPYIYWAESKLTLGAFSSPYGIKIVNVIGLEFSGRLDMAANVGWIGSGYANAGPVGVLAYALGIGLLIAVLTAFAERFDARVVVAANAPLVVTVLYASDFVTSLLTHGILVSLLVLSCVRPFGQGPPS
jgi:hypothetical protein